ncbi:protein FAM83G-like [Gouania willdenowi]|uniref:Protein FAM83G-like n=1 Tax=Gouania willdenowi TaxID=441366 RepID=A0A8C5DHU5_GOUWI|nr:protein FAM83G-like [Gouania willdenowi]
MALSQVQCLDDHHVNWRVSESKPEFFYSENQRLALEALITEGRDAFTDYVCKSGVRGFLSELELERISCTAEAFRPGHEHVQKTEIPASPGYGTPGLGEEADDGQVSLEYWPDRSEGSVAELDLGWPESISYRGVTRVAIYTQPPMDGHTHIKEVVRKSIASAQKMIAVVMDAFTDVDIFRDLLDAAYRRKVAVYIILDMAAVPCFLTMCGRADMHRGHLKHLRVRCCGGVEFFTRTAQKVCGSLSQKFLLADGDRAITGSYSFTWSSSRLDRNLITVVTGQAVETFDLQFRELYLISRGVSLSKVPMVDEPIPDPLPQVAPAPVPAAIARKLVNPKYSLVTTSSVPSDQNSNNKVNDSQTPNGLKIMKRLKGVIEEPPLHPGLVDMEKAYLIPYLPTWPEPDPPSDVIGFINIRDEKRAHQVHLQRSEMFEFSQAIRFSSPLTAVAKPEESVQNKKAAATTQSPPPPDKAPLKDSPPSDSTDEPPQQPSVPPPQDIHDPKPNTCTTESNVIANSPPADKEVEQTPETQMGPPPLPKPRTLQLIIDSPTKDSSDSEVTLMKMDQLENLDDSFDKNTAMRNVKLVHGRLTSKGDAGDSGEDSQDSTKVICDRAANENPSSASTVSDEEFFDCSQQSSPISNGVMSGSGHGQRQSDNFNLMARFSQSMLDLRDSNLAEDGATLIRQSQELRRKGFPSPHRNFGRLFGGSRSPGREAKLRGNKVIITKPSFHRPARAAGPAMGGYRYWQRPPMEPDSAPQFMHSRSGRSPRRHSPGYKKTDRSTPQPQAGHSGLLGVSFPKLSNFRPLRSRGGSQKKMSQSNKPGQ